MYESSEEIANKSLAIYSFNIILLLHWQSRYSW